MAKNGNFSRKLDRAGLLLGGTSTPAAWLHAASCPAALPAGLQDLLPAVRAQAGPRRLGVVILSEYQGAHDGIVCISAVDWRALFWTLPGDPPGDGVETSDV